MKRNGCVKQELEHENHPDDLSHQTHSEAGETGNEKGQ